MLTMSTRHWPESVTDLAGVVHVQSPGAGDRVRPGSSALTYRVAELETIKRIAWFCMNQENNGFRMLTSMPTTASVPLTRKVVSRTSPIFRSMTWMTHPKITIPFPLMKARKKMNEELQQVLKYLRLWSLLANWDELLVRARCGKFSHERFLKLVLEGECRSKNDNARVLRRQRAHIPELLEIETYPFSRQPKLDRERIMSLYDSLDFS